MNSNNTVGGKCGACAGAVGLFGGRRTKLKNTMRNSNTRKSRGGGTGVAGGCRGWVRYRRSRRQKGRGGRGGRCVKCNSNKCKGKCKNTRRNQRGQRGGSGFDFLSSYGGNMVTNFFTSNGTLNNAGLLSGMQPVQNPLPFVQPITSYGYHNPRLA